MKTIEEISMKLMTVVYGIGIIVSGIIFFYVIRFVLKKMFPGNPWCDDVEEANRPPDGYD